MFYCKFSKIFKNICFTEHLCTTASEKIYWLENAYVSGINIWLIIYYYDFAMYGMYLLQRHNQKPVKKHVKLKFLTRSYFLVF